MITKQNSWLHLSSSQFRLCGFISFIIISSLLSKISLSSYSQIKDISEYKEKIDSMEKLLAVQSYLLRSKDKNEIKNNHIDEIPYLDETSLLETKIFHALEKRGDSITPIAKEPMDDVRVTKLQLSPGRPLYATLDDFDFLPYFGNERWSHESTPSPIPLQERNGTSALIPVPSQSNVERLVCHIDRSYINLKKWQHYIQMAAPCWSLFQRYPDAKHFIDLNMETSPLSIRQQKKIRQSEKEIKPQEWASWILVLNRYFYKEGVHFIDEKYLKKSETYAKDWIASTQLKLIEEGHGWADPSGEGPLVNCKYFMEAEDIYKLQKAVLGSQFADGPSNEKLRLLVLNRHDATQREWVYADETLNLIKNEWNNVIETKIIPSFTGYSFEQQALEIHKADVIISPHGAQLTNIFFARPCTTMLELFPRGFYYPKKGPLLMEAGGIAFDGYHFDGSPVAETPPFDIHKDESKHLRIKLRDTPIYASPTSILYSLPDILQAAVNCRKQSLLR